MRFVCSLAAALSLSVASIAVAADSIEIPLESIWGLDLRGPRPLRELEPEYFDPMKPGVEYSADDIAAMKQSAENAMTRQLEREMLKLSPHVDRPMKRGFAVSGTGRDALKGVHNVLVSGRKPSAVLSSEGEVCAVFFSYPSQVGVSLDHVERNENKVQIYYLLTARGQQSMDAQLWVIPLGMLISGDYEVQLIRSPKDKGLNPKGLPLVDEKLEQRIVCRPFKFTVEQQ